MRPTLLFIGDIGGSELLLLFLLVIPLGLIFHFLPSILARRRPDFWIIFAINLLAGWSIIGWIVALVLALRSEVLMVGATAPPSVADELMKLQSLRATGVLTEAEFEQQKQQLLR
jgi:hypothetical protein